MGKKLRKTIKKTNTKHNSSAASIPPPITTDPVKKEKGTLFKKVKIAVEVVVLLLTIYFFKDPIRRQFMTEQEIYEEENFFKGILIPNTLIDSNQDIVFDFGAIGRSGSIKDLKNGVDYSTSLFPPNPADPFNLSFQLINNRIYVSTVLKDVSNVEFLAEIRANKFKIFKGGNFLNYSSTDTSLQILDKGNRVVLNMVFEKPNVIKVQGYWTNDRYIDVIRNDAMTFFHNRNNPEDFREALKSIDAIVPFPVNKD